MEINSDHKEQDEQELLMAKLSEVLPDIREPSREDLAKVLCNYVGRFQKLYSSPYIEEGGENLALRTVTLNFSRHRQLQVEARLDLRILNTVLPIKQSAKEVIPWDISEKEKEKYGDRTIPVSWERCVEALGRYMAGAYPKVD